MSKATQLDSEAAAFVAETNVNGDHTASHELPPPAMAPAPVHTPTISVPPPIADSQLPGPAITQALANVNLRSDQFKDPPDSEGEFVRKTYAHFAATGVPDDGFTEGKEYTRERRGLSAWEEAALSPPSNPAFALRDHAKRSPSIGQSLSASPQIAPQDPAAPEASTSFHANGKGIENSPNLRTSFAQEVPGASKIASTTSAVDHHLGPKSPPASALATSTSSESAVSSTTFLSGNEWQRRQDAAEKKRQELIAKIDRYGFFSDPASVGYHRSILLRASLFDAPFPKKGSTGLVDHNVPKPTTLASDLNDGNRHSRTATSATDRSPSTIADARAGFDDVHRRKEKARIAKWSRMLSVESRDQGHNAVSYTYAGGLSAKRLRRRVFKGIPDIWRSAAWMALLQRRDTGEVPPKSASSNPDEQFADLKEKPSPHDVQIDLDVPRTISGHIQFHTRYGQGQRDLFHVLHDVSLLCSDCGYCQGMGPIAATFLCYFPPEQVYAVMVMTHNKMGLHDTFRPGFPGLVENLYVQDQLVRTYMPEMYTAFKDNMVSTSAYATKWYITLFSNSIPFETQLRIWDAWLLEGQDVITLAALAILWSLRAIILDPQADFEVILGALSSYFVPENDDSLLLWVGQALKRKDLRRVIVDARAEYRRLIENGDPVDML